MSPDKTVEAIMDSTFHLYLEVVCRLLGTPSCDTGELEVWQQFVHYKTASK